MTRLERWLGRAARDERERATLEEALIGDRFAAYARYRLRWVALGRSTAVIVHLVEFVFLAHIFGERGLASALVVANACGLAAGFWWGGLELLRNRLQDAGKAQSSHETSVWLGRAVIAAALVLAATAMVLGVRWADGGVDLLGAYALVVAARLAVDLVARTYYSGVYARRRVYRPVLAILATELSSLVAIAGLWPWLGPWSFPAGLALSVLASRAVLVVYTARAYAAQRMPRPRVALRRALRVRRRSDGVIFALAGLAGATTRLGSLLVLLVLFGGGGLGPAAVVLHLSVPLLTTASAWPQVFYLDFRRLDEHLAAALLRRLRRRLAPLALLIGVALWLVACAVVLSRIELDDAAVPLAGLLPLMVALSWLGRVQLEYFARKQYLRVCAGGVAVAAALLLALVGADAVTPAMGAPSRPLAIVAAVALGIAVTELWRSRRRAQPARGRLRSLSPWLTALTACREPVVVGAVHAGDARADQLAALADAIAARLGEAGAVAPVRGRRLVWFDVGGGHLARRDLLVASAGLVDAIDVTPIAADGAGALAQATAMGLITPPAAGAVEGVEGLVARARGMFPAVMVEVLVDGRGGAELARLEPTVRRAVWLDAVTDARGGRRARPRSGYDVSTFVRGGEIAALFVVPADAPLELRRRWRGELERANWAAATAASA